MDCISDVIVLFGYLLLTGCLVAGLIWVACWVICCDAVCACLVFVYLLLVVVCAFDLLFFFFGRDLIVHFWLRCLVSCVRLRVDMFSMGDF